MCCDGNKAWLPEVDPSTVLDLEEEAIEELIEETIPSHRYETGEEEEEEEEEVEEVEKEEVEEVEKVEERRRGGW